MGIPDGAHTHDSGGSGLGTAVLVVLGAAVAVKLAAPVLAAASELLNIVLIAAAVIGGLGAAGLVALLAWQWRRTLAGAARATPPLPAKVVRAALPLPKAQRPRELPAGLHGQTPGELHLHFHGFTAEDVAAIISRHGMPTRPNEVDQ
jgi:hypothetical protein